MWISFSGRSRHFQLRAWDQYSRVSKALVRSAMKRYRVFLDCRASSVIALRVRSGAAVPPPGRAPNWAPSSMWWEWRVEATLPITMCSYTLRILSIRAMGLVALRSERPLGVLGSRRRMAVFISSGTSPLENHVLNTLVRVRILSVCV